MNTEIIVGLIGLISTIASSAVTFMLTKKKYNAEVEADVIQNLKDSLDFYRQISDDNREKLEEYRKENDELRAQVNELQKQMFTLMRSICYNATCATRELSKQFKAVHKPNGNKDSKKS